MPPEPRGPEPRQRRVTWRRATRIVAARYPPIDLFERVSNDPSVWEALIAAEQLVNPRVRDSAGEIRLVPAAERVSGPGASFVMAAFTHRNPHGSRFSDGSHGVYYAARTLLTAVRETAFHFARFAADSRDPPRYEDMRVLVGRVDQRFVDVGALAPAEQARLLDPNAYAAGQSFGAAVRAAGANGVVYASVRDAGGECIGAFKPTAVGIPVPGPSLKYHWDGARVARYFDYESGRWVHV
jgi:RES domain